MLQKISTAPPSWDYLGFNSPIANSSFGSCFRLKWYYGCMITFLPLDFFSVSDKNEDKISKRAQWMPQSRARAFQPKRIQENVFLLNWKAHAKIQALLKEKISPKVTCIHLAPNHSIAVFNCEVGHNFRFESPISWRNWNSTVLITSWIKNLMALCKTHHLYALMLISAAIIAP